MSFDGICVVSTNPSKISAAGLLLEYPQFSGTPIFGKDFPSGVSEQPLSLEETKTGATTRVLAACAKEPADVVLAFEAGMYEAPHTYSGWQNITVAALRVKGRMYYGYSSPIEWPAAWVKVMLEQKVSIAKAARITGFSNDPELAHKCGLIGALVGNGYSREQYMRESLRGALMQYLHPQLYLKRVVCAICSRAKAKGPLPPSELYLGTHIKKVAAHAEQAGVPFFVLSGLYGFIESSTLVHSYDYLLTEEGVKELSGRIAAQLIEHRIGFVNLFAKRKPSWQPYIEALLLAAGSTDTVIDFDWLPDDA